MYAKCKWMTRNDTRVGHISYAKRLPILIAPSTRAELTIYYFYHGKRFSHGMNNCRCTSVPL